jgi:retinol dehydrogenase 14
LRLTEHTFALNHLAPFLLTNLLLDRLKASAPARIVTTEPGVGYRLRGEE